MAIWVDLPAERHSWEGLGHGLRVARGGLVPENLVNLRVSFHGSSFWAIFVLFVLNLTFSEVGGTVRVSLDDLNITLIIAKDSEVRPRLFVDLDLP